MIYFLEAVGHEMVKIGFAVNVKNRIATLSTGCPYELRLLGEMGGGRTKEAELHRRFSSLRLRGEWFQLTEEIAALAAETIKDRIPKWIDDCPVLAGHTCDPRFGPQSEYCHLDCECPKCGGRLTHGFEPGADWQKPSHRVSHCGCWSRGYYIEASEDFPSHKFDPRVSLAGIPLAGKRR